MEFWSGGYDVHPLERTAVFTAGVPDSGFGFDGTGVYKVLTGLDHLAGAGCYIRVGSGGSVVPQRTIENFSGNCPGEK